MGTGYVGTEHILIALIRENDNIAVRIMVSLDLNLQRLYDDIMNMLGEGEEPEQQRSRYEQPRRKTGKKRHRNTG